MDTLHTRTAPSIHSQAEPPTLGEYGGYAIYPMPVFVCPAADTPWNTHDLTVADPDGNLFTFTARAAGYEPRDLDAAMQQAAAKLARRPG